MHRRNEKTHKQGVGEETTQVKVPAMIWRAPRYMITAPTTPSSRSKTGSSRGRGQASKTLSSRRLHAGENTALAIFGVIALHHAYAAKRFGQPAGDFCVNLSAFAEDGPDGAESLAQVRAQKPSRK